VFLDRDYVRATVVPQGDRTYRRFTRDQILSLWVFLRMVQDGMKPSMAKVYIQKMELILASASDFLKPIVAFIFSGGSCHPILAGESGHRWDGWMLPYSDLCEHLDQRELPKLPAADEEVRES
jgi:hypothetical protein